MTNAAIQLRMDILNMYDVSGEPPTQAELAHALLFTRECIAHNCKKLKEFGFLKQERSDRRFEITEKGIRRVKYGILVPMDFVKGVV